MLSIGVICLNAADWKRAARFWAAALGYTPHPQAADILVPPDGEGPRLALYQRDRTHLDLHTANRADQQAEVERLLALGARRADVGQGDVPWVVLQDPEGNEFCVLGERQA